MKSNEMNNKINKNTEIPFPCLKEKQKQIESIPFDSRKKKDSPSEIVALHHAIVTYSQKPSFDVESKF